MQQFERINTVDKNKRLNSQAADIVDIIQLRQFISQRKAWLVTINYMYQVSLIEFTFPLKS